MNISMEDDGVMNKNKPMPILLIEDDAIECRKFKECAGNRTDLILIGTTDSSYEGLQLVKTRLPEGVILDLELTKGKGDGLQFLTELRETKLGLRPIIVVTTNIQSEVMTDHLHEMGVSFVFSKKQNGYTSGRVLNILLNLRNSLLCGQKDSLPANLQTIESLDEQRVRIFERIDAEINQIEIRLSLKGRIYLKEAIYLQIIGEKNESCSVLYQVAEKYRINYNSVIRAIQTVIENAWRSTDTDTLKKQYPMYISPRTGVPAPTDFIRYYAEKIRKTM
jgi:DNA-binding NarL/FixJ family response regulator